MEQRRFCAKCNAPEVKGMSACVVCGCTDFVLPQTETSVRVVEIEDAVVKTTEGNKFIKAPCESTEEVLAQEESVSLPEQYEDVQSSSDNSTEEKSSQAKRPAMPKEGRTVVYKSFEEYERELAEKGVQEDELLEPKKEKKSGGKGGFIFLCILLSLLLVVGGFVLGVYLTYSGALDSVLPARANVIGEEYQAEIDACNQNRVDLAEALATYITANGIYIDKTTIVTIECADDGDYCVISVEGDCLSKFDCEALLGNDYMCPTEGTYEAKIIPYVNDEGVPMFEVRVTCDGESGEWAHS